MSEAISAQGTLVEWESTVGGPFVEIGDLRDITPPPLTRNAIEMTNHNEQEEIFVVGIKRKGELTFTIGFNPDAATHDHLTGLQKGWDDGLKRGFRITYPNDAQFIFSGYVTNVAPSAPIDDALTAEITIRPSGASLFVAAP